VGIYEDHLVRLNTLCRPIVNQYREGKVKRTPARGVKEYLKPYAYKQWEGYAWGSPRECLTACLLHNEPASYSQWQG
jgi:hypothetical protein